MFSCTTTLINTGSGTLQLWEDNKNGCFYYKYGPHTPIGGKEKDMSISQLFSHTHTASFIPLFVLTSLRVSGSQTLCRGAHTGRITYGGHRRCLSLLRLLSMQTIYVFHKLRQRQGFPLCTMTIGRRRQ